MKRLRPWLLLSVLGLPTLLVAGDVIDTYSLDRTAVQNSILGVFRGGWYAFDVTPALRALPPSERAAAVRALGEFTRGYVESPAFKTEYVKAWKATKPKGFGLPSLDAGALARRAVDKARGNSDDASRTALDKDPNVTLRRRLQEFLDVSADVDFAAATTGSGSGRRFVKEEYEAKSNQWKMCFRAGREATEAARAFAQEWMESLPAK
jgi:hypothetical protein